MFRFGRDGQSLGVLSVQSYAPNAYTPEDLRTLQALADYGSGALERLRNEESLRQREAFNCAIPATTMDGYYVLDFAADPRGAFVEANDAYCRITGLLRERLPEFRTMLGKSFADFGEGKFAVRIISEKGAERFARFACAYALKRRERKFPGKLTLVTKSNVLWATDGVMERVVQAEVKKYPELAYERFYVDDAARRLIRFPDSFDVIATSNLFGDVLGDEAAELVGGIGLAGSACVGGKVPYFEAIHGSAPDIAGKGIANPTATIIAARLMLEYFGMDEAAAVLEKAIESVYAEGKHLTPDQGGNSSTDEMADAILSKIR